MGSTFLTLTNKVLKRFNEVALTSSNFDTATGLARHAKQAVNESINFIQQREFQWPFNIQAGSQTFTAGVQLYALPSDYRNVDMDTFYINRDETLEVAGTPLRLIEYDEWVNWYRSNDEEIINVIADIVSVPRFVFKTPDDKFGISPPPSKAYVLDFDYWNVASDLSANGDTTLIPIRFDQVITDGASIKIHTMRENILAADKADERFNTGITNMRTQLINQMDHATDTRTSQRSKSWYGG